MSKRRFGLQPLEELRKVIFDYRHGIALGTFVLIFIVGFFLYLEKNWTAKDAAQVCTGFLIVLSLFFTVLSLGFSTTRMRHDHRTAKELLTYNAAIDYQKIPIKDYWTTLAEHEDDLTRWTGSDHPDLQTFNSYLKNDLEVRIAVNGF